MNSETRLQKHQKHLAELMVTRDIMLGIVGNPMICLVGGVALIEYLERKDYMGSIIATTTEAGLIGVCTAQALAPLAPAIGQGLATILPALGLATAIPGVPPPP